MPTYAVINESNVVINTIIWDGVSQWAPPKGCFLIENDQCGPGWTYNPSDKTFSPAKE